jgi:hypothetical protein
MAQVGNTIPYDPIFDEVRKNHGYIDTRGQPELVAKIPESHDSDALNALLVALAAVDANCFSVGCDLGQHEESTNEKRRHVAGGYVQLLHREYLSFPPEEYQGRASAIEARIAPHSMGSDWELRFELSSVAFRVSGALEDTFSVWLWFFARAEKPIDARASRERLIAQSIQLLSTHECADDLISIDGKIYVAMLQG